MALSLNQVEHTARKAARGAGLPWGLAEDAGRAVRWLEMLDLPGMLWLSRLLDALPHDPIDPLRIGEVAGEWRAASGPMSPLLAGPSLADWVGMQAPGSLAAVVLINLACPGLCAGYLGVVSDRRDRSVRLSCDGIDLVVHDQGVIMVEGNPVSLCGGADRVMVETLAGPLDVDGVRHRPSVGSRDIDPGALGMLELLAHKTYVEASEVSRLTGAGAGLQDND